MDYTNYMKQLYIYIYIFFLQVIYIYLQVIYIYICRLYIYIYIVAGLCNNQTTQHKINYCYYLLHK